MQDEATPAVDPVPGDPSPADVSLETGGGSSSDTEETSSDAVVTPPPTVDDDVSSATDRDFSALPSFVITCPTCNTSIPWTPEIEGFEPSLSSKTKTCDECEGFGWVRTGSHVPEHSSKTCDVCNGLGYVDENGLAVAPTFSATTTPSTSPQWNPVTGQWE